MANEELVKPENTDFSFRHDHFTGIRHNFELFPSHDYNSTFEHLLDTNLQINASSMETEVWNHETKEELALGGEQNDSYLHCEVEKSTKPTHKNESDEINDNLELRVADPEHELVVGMEFSDVNACRKSMRDLAISQSFEMQTLKSDKTRFTAKCMSEGCPWRIHCAKVANEPTFTIRTIHSSHTCGGKKHLGHHQASAQWVAEFVEEKLKENPKLKPKEILEEIHRVHGIALSYKQAWRGKERILATLRLLPQYCDEIRTNPESIALVHGNRIDEKEDSLLPQHCDEIRTNPESIALVHGNRIDEKEYSLAPQNCGRTNPGSIALVQGNRINENEDSLLPQYCEEITRTNPGSIALVHGNPINGTFQHLFISFKASISGFLNTCKPLIALDKTLLKRKHKRTLLLATGFDGEGAVLPLAFAIVNEENDTNWHRFLSELRKILEANSENIPKLTILSSREKSIVDGVDANFPTAIHGLCVHYLTEQFKREFKSHILVHLLWEAAHALTIFEFKSKLNEIQQLSPEASVWIQHNSPSLWASSYFEGTRFGQLTANVITESLSNWIQDAKGLPLIQIMECFHNHLMSLFKERREKTSSHCSSSLLVPSAEKQVVSAIEQSLLYRVYRANEAEFEVKSREGNVIVDIKKRSCSCRRWEVHGLPCSHGAGALLSCKEDVYSYTERCFTVENYKRTYEERVEPVSDRDQWKVKDEFEIRTPEVRRTVKRRRRRFNGEPERVKRVVHCSRCNQTGHFRTTCDTLM